jgi:hypothetical protein
LPEISYRDGLVKIEKPATLGILELEEALAKL